MHVDGAIQSVVHPFAQGLDQVLARTDTSPRPRQAFEQVEFQGGQFQCHITQNGRACGRIEPQRPDDDFWFLARFAPRRSRTARYRHLIRAAAPRHRPQAREEFARGKRLGQIVVRAHFQAHDAVGFLAARREHEHRHIGNLADAAQHLEAVRARQHHVEDHRVEAFHRRVLRAGDAIVLGCGLVAQRREVVADQLAEFPVVVDDKHAHGWREDLLTIP